MRITFFNGVNPVIDILVAIEGSNTTMFHEQQCPKLKEIVDIPL
jgi:hypothetical protein